MPDTKIRVLYIAGSGRSGSTVLSILLDRHPELVSPGELCNLTRTRWSPDQYCACGELGTVCPFWAEVRERWYAAVTDEEGLLDEYLALQHRFEGHRVLPSMFGDLAWNSAAFERYSELTRELLRAVSEAAGSQVIVDASKLPARAWALARMPWCDLRLVHLVRDLRGVAWSRKKSLQKDVAAGVQHDLPSTPIGRSVLGWCGMNLATEWLAWRELAPEKLLRLRYEDLIHAPEPALMRLGELAGVDLSDVARSVAAGEAVAAGHQVAGNRLRLSGPLRLREDTSWRQGLSRDEQRRIGRLGGWLMRRYGYDSRIEIE